MRAIFNVVVRPHVVAVLGPEPDAGAIVETEAPALRLLGRHFQPLALPDPFDPFGVVEPMGADSLAWGAVGDRPVAARVEADQAMPLGATVEASFNAGQVSLFGDDGRRL